MYNKEEEFIHEQNRIDRSYCRESRDFQEREQLKNDDKVQLVGFGTFEVSKRAAREGRNPQTGKTMKIAACKAPKFKAGKALKDAIN